MTPEQTLIQAFQGLSQEQRENLRANAQAGVKICCGARANMFTDASDGAG